LNHWLDVSRYYYNKTIELYNNERMRTYTDKDGEKKLGYFCHPVSRLKKDSDGVSFQVFLMEELKADWNENVPYKVKQMPIDLAYRAGKLVNAKNKQFNKDSGSNPSRLSYQRKKDESGIIYVDNVSLSKTDNWKLKVWSTSLGEMKFKDSKKTKELINKGDYCDGNITLENDKWFLNLPFKVKTKSVDNQNDIVALDPGVRTFITAYSNEEVFHFANNDFKQITSLLLWCDELKSQSDDKMNIWKLKRSNGNYKKWMKIRHKFKLSLERVRNLIKEVHFKVARYLCIAYKTIVLPTTEISEMVLTSNRKIRSKTVRSLLSWSYYRFSEIVKAKAEEFNVRIIRIGEEYTSKTCTGCGVIHNSLGGNKVFKCPSCNIEIDRDINGARNILLKALCS